MSAAPRAPLRLVVLAALPLLAADRLARAAPPPAPSRDLQLPRADVGTAESGTDDTARLLVELTAEGDIRVHESTLRRTRDGELVPGYRLMGMTLDALGRSLETAVRLHEARLRAMDERTRDRFPSGATGARLRVLFAVDARPPWRHVQWLLAEAAAQSIYKTEFAVRREHETLGALAAWLPFDATKENALDAVRDRQILRVAAGGETYRLGDRTTSDRKVLREWLAAARQERRSTWVEVDAAATVPHGTVVSVLALCREVGITRVDFTGAPEPPDDARTARRLPPPTAARGAARREENAEK